MSLDKIAKKNFVVDALKHDLRKIVTQNNDNLLHEMIDQRFITQLLYDYMEIDAQHFRCHKTVHVDQNDIQEHQRDVFMELDLVEVFIIFGGWCFMTVVVITAGCI